ncbi:hypothetical protein KGP26_07625 [Serratia sp. JSRIV002]|uniref:hypothetical protein n=1 Tax=Serratia sp. JSRIV002 TaxID=2831894 RepID=UPI001CBE3978|nr:hypothetical protein [Serratia sp. JSRIV002]UAN52921.1 hypothetical protein KGP26_07625 [Serratia sp. JSRIV002]
MKSFNKVVFAIILSILPIYSLASDAADICRSARDGGYRDVITLGALNGGELSTSDNLVVCFKGLDISQKIASKTGVSGLAGEGLRVTSGIKVDEYEEFYIAFYNDSTGVASIERVLSNHQGRLISTEGLVLKKRDMSSASPDAEFRIFGVNKLPAFHNVYFNIIEPTSSSIYRFRDIPGKADLPAKLEHFSDGYGEYVGSSGLVSVSSTEIIEGKGRQLFGALFGSDGKRICDLDANETGWALFQKCIKR